jgi:GDPmannose 4,6-dehydratase
MHAMLQISEPQDFVIGTGESHSVREFLQPVLESLKELGVGSRAPRSIEEWVQVDPRFLRTGEMHDLRADASRAKADLGWQPTVDFKSLVRMMVESDLKSAESSTATV